MSLSPAHRAADPGGCSNPVTNQDRINRKQWEFNSFPTVWASLIASSFQRGFAWGMEMLSLAAEHTAPLPSSAFGQDTQILQPRCVTNKSCSAPNNIPEFSQVLQRYKSGICFNQRDQREPACPTDLTTQAANARGAGKASGRRAQGSRAWSQAPSSPRDPPPSLPQLSLALQQQQKIVQSKHSSLRAVSVRAVLGASILVPCHCSPLSGTRPVPCLWQLTWPYATHWLVPQNSLPFPGSPPWA